MNSAKCPAWLSLVLLIMFCIATDTQREYQTIRTPNHSSRLISEIQSGETSKVLLLFIIDFNDFMCMSCLDSFLSFCRSIPSRSLEKNAWGVCVLADIDKKPEKKDSGRIAEKKLRGFIAANSIPFPVIIDHSRVFQSFAADGTAIVIIDVERKRIARYNFPIGNADARKIGELFRNN